MTMTRAIAVLFVASFTASSAFAQPTGEEPASPAATPAVPEVAPAAAPGSPAPSVLRPNFQVGQHAVVSFVSRSSRTAHSLVQTIDVEVLECSEGVTVLRWQVRPFDHPSIRDMSPELQEAVRAQHPSLELLFTDNVGITGIRNWQEAFDAYQDMTLNIELRKPSPDGKPVDPVPLRERREKLRSIRPVAAQAWLLKEVRGYFSGAFQPIQSAQTIHAEKNFPVDLGGAEGIVELPFLVTMSLWKARQDPPSTYLLRIEGHLHPEKSLEPMTAIMFKKAPEVAKQHGVTEEIVRQEILQVAASIKATNSLEWEFDVDCGWPRAATETSRVSFGTEIITHTATWTLVEGPTMKAKSTDPAQPDAAQPNPAPSDAPADPK